MSKKTDALLGRLKTVLENEADKDAAIERASMEAMMRTQSRRLREFDEGARAEIFAEFEQAATARDRKLIAAHPLRAHTGVIRSRIPITSGQPIRFDPVADSGASDRLGVRP